MKYLAVCVLLACIASVAAAQTPINQAVLSWNAVTLNEDGTAVTGPVTYNVWQGPQAGPFVRVAALQGVSVLTETVTGLPLNTQTCWEVTSVADSGSESPASNVACKTIGNETPGAPNLTVK